jgi:hypothetical protein
LAAIVPKRELLTMSNEDEAYVYLGSDKLGRRIKCEEFAALDPRKIYWALIDHGACGVEGVLFLRSDGDVGLDDASSVNVVEAGDVDDYEAANEIVDRATEDEAA